MGEKTGITWTDHTFNPWWGCTRVSAGCDNCYADSWARRMGLKLWDGRPRRFFGQKHWTEPLKWNAAAAAAGVRRKVFCGSMCDVFEIAQSAELDKPRERLWDLIDRTPNLDWLLLTKRPENIPALAPRAWVGGWPANILALATAENQAVCENRVGALCAVPASVTGLSLEPLLGPVDLSLARLPSGSSCHPLRVQPGHYPISGNVCRISWLIIGCEKMACNRPGRPCELLWVRDLIRQARATAGVKVFVKQLEVDGRVSADPADWPEDLRIQEFPQ